MPFTRAEQCEAFRRMLRIRKFEEEGTRLFKAGQIPGAYHASIGQEGAIVGACMALRNDDAMTGTHRSHGHPIGKGAGPLNHLFRFHQEPPARGVHEVPQHGMHPAAEPAAH